jgi:hypothetical protein
MRSFSTKRSHANVKKPNFSTFAPRIHEQILLSAEYVDGFQEHPSEFDRRPAIYF